MMPKMASIATTQIPRLFFLQQCRRMRAFLPVRSNLSVKTTQKHGRVDALILVVHLQVGGSMDTFGVVQITWSPCSGPCLGPVPVGRMGLVITCHRLQTSKLRLGIESIEDV